MDMYGLFLGLWHGRGLSLCMLNGQAQPSIISSVGHIYYYGNRLGAVWTFRSMD